MIVCAIDCNYREYTKLFLLSLIKNSPSSVRRLRYFVFDYARNKKEYRKNCYYAMLQLLRINRHIDLTMMPYADISEIYEKFKKLFRTLGIRYFLKTNMMDYLKAYIFKYLGEPYLFLDNDIIVCGGIEELYNRCKEKGKISMGKLKHFRLLNFFEFYNLYTRLKLNSRFRYFGQLCSGVIFIPKDYTNTWFNIFSRGISRFGIGGHPGLGSWNVLFWEEKGYLLPERYNCIMNRTRKACKNAVLLHFPERFKQRMLNYKF